MNKELHPDDEILYLYRKGVVFYTRTGSDKIVISSRGCDLVREVNERAVNYYEMSVPEYARVLIDHILEYREHYHETGLLTTESKHDSRIV